MKRPEDLFTPRGGGIRFGIHYDPDAFGRFSEGVARYFGTARFLVVQTGLVFIWIVVNSLAFGFRWDPYPFILLNLAFSTQAAYAAPLILLAQNRQDEREREVAQRDREMNTRTLADTEFISRELAAIRIALQDVVTNSDLDRRLERLIDELHPPRPDADDAASGAEH